MTVSPQRAQDGRAQPNSRPKGVQLGGRMETLPPTLFQLPSLKPSSSKTANVNSEASEQDDQPRSPTPPAVQTGVSTPGNAHVPAPEPVPAAAPTTSPEPSSSRWDDRTPASMYPADQPAGRSWMETVRSHGVMVVLLLIVVVAAVVTSRGTSNSDESSVAEKSDLLSIDEGLAVELPLPSEVISEDASLARGSTGGSGSSVGQVRATPLTVGHAGLSAPSIANSTAPATVSDQIPNLSSGTTEATTVAGRIPSDTDGFSLSSQAEELQFSAPDQVGQVAKSRYRLSSTPAPVTDWLQQLDKYQRAQQLGAEYNSTPQ